MNGHKLFLFALIASGMVLAILPAHAADVPLQTVVEVRVRGNTSMTTNAILNLVKTRAGQVYDEAVLRSDEQQLLTTGRFSRVETEKTQAAKGLIITFVVFERPTIAKVLFHGNKALKEADLAKELAVSTGGPLSEYSAEAGRTALVNKYRAEGYYYAEISYDKDALQKQHQLVYTIIEGPQVKIRKILFEGNKFFYTIKLRIEVGASARFWPFIKGYLDTDQVDRDVDTIRNLYIGEGFLDVEVGRRLEFSPDKKDVRLIFVIRENQRYRVNTVKFVGNKIFSDAELSRRVKFKQGEFYTAVMLRRDLKALQDTYGELGYIYAKVDSRKEYLSPDATAPAWAGTLGRPALLNVVYTLKENDQYRVGQITIHGNTITQARVIRRELRFYPEQLYNTVAVDESKKLLTESRLFDNVSITPTGNTPGVRDSLVEVKEGKTAEFTVGVGVSSRDGLLGNVSVTQRNFDIMAWPNSNRQFAHGQAFKGAGQTMTVSAEPGTQIMRFTIDWYTPYIFDQPYSLDVKAYVFRRTRESYDETRFGPVVSIGHTFKNQWYGELSTRVEGVQIDHFTDDTPPEVEDVSGMNFPLVGFKGTIARNRTDSRWMPSEGDSIRLSYEQVTGAFNFGRALGEYHIYKTVYEDALDRKHILAGKAMVGDIISDAPVFERFYGGGLGSIRGFKYRGISPRSEGTDQPIGGDFSMFLGTEYTFPIITDMIRGVLFIDSGTVEPKAEIGTYRVSAGVGLQWIIPFFGPVPMDLDFGFPICKSPEDDRELVSFSFGWTF